jgi:hypothetical protein
LYADTFTTNACKGLGNFAPIASPPITEISRIEGCKKGAAYLNVWMYVIHEMEEAIDDCKKSVAVSTHWDEAVAFYTGSTTLDNPTVNYGVFQYGLAEKKCPLFNTCGASSDNTKLYKSTVNEKVMSLFATGNSYRTAGRCSNLEMVKEALVKQFTVPIIQGIMQYLYQSTTDGKEKSKSELWSFASAVLPLVNSYSPSVAKTLLDNSLITNVVTVPSGVAAVKASLESVYGAIGITCSDVGGFVNPAVAGTYYSGMEPCSDNGIVGYTTYSAVTQHLRLDLDQNAMQTALGLTPPKFDDAFTAYSKGNMLASSRNMLASLTSMRSTIRRHPSNVTTKASAL